MGHRAPKRCVLTVQIRCSILEHLTAALANQDRMALRYADLFGVNPVRDWNR